jgi:carbonic anhydrase
MRKPAHCLGCTCLTRRGALAGLTLLAGAAIAGSAAAQTLTRAERDAMTPDQVIAEMRAGNERFRTGQQRPRDWMAQQRAAAAGQYPKAVLLSCIDSRAPAEIITDMGLGDFFNSRIAGNVHDVAVLGGMEFACRLAGAKLVMVLGHTACGAVAGAIANAELGNLTALLAKIRPAVQATIFSGERAAGNAAFVDAVARTNVALTVAGIRRDSPVLAEMERAGAIRIVGAMYDLASGTVDFMT